MRHPVKERPCPRCGKPMIYVTRRRRNAYRCNNADCGVHFIKYQKGTDKIIEMILSAEAEAAANG